MGDTSRIVDIPFAGGLDQKQRAELLAPGSFLRLENLVQNKQGTYEKSPGQNALSPAILDPTPMLTLTAGERLMQLQDEVLVADGRKLYGYSTMHNAWKAKSRLPEAVDARLPIASLASSNPGYADIAIASNGLACAVYAVLITGTNTSQIFAQIFNPATGAALGAPALISSTNYQNIRVVSQGTYFVAGVQTVGSATINFFSIDSANATSVGPKTPTWTTTTTLVTDGHAASQSFDMVGLTDRFALIYTHQTDGFLNIKTVDASTMTVVQSLAGVSTAFAPTRVTIGGVQTDTLWFSWNTPGNTNVYVQGCNPTTLSSLFSVVIAATFAVGTTFASLGLRETTNNAGILAITAIDAAAESSISFLTFSRTGSAVSSGALSGLKRRLRTSTRPLSDGTRYFVCATDSDGAFPQSMFFVGDITEDVGTLRPVCSSAPRLSYAFGDGSAHVIPLGTGKVGVLNVNKRASSAYALELVTLDFANKTRWQASLFGDVACISGGIPSYCDGGRAEEIGFLTAPRITAVTYGGGGTGTVPAGTCQYIAIYEKVDRRGNVHRSAPSTPFSTTTAVANNSASVSVTTLQVSARTDSNDSASNVRIVLYRTAPTSTGVVFYRVAGAEQNSAQLNSVTVLSDTLADATVQAQEQLYTQPGTAVQGVATAQPKRAPPSFVAQIAHQDRLVGLDGAGNVWFSGQRVIGEGPWFTDLFQFPVGIGKRGNALASQDGRIIVFKPDPIIAYVEGDGPPDSGVGNDFSPPRYVPTDVGCSNPRSVVTTPIGTFFQSTRGIELLNRSMQVEPFFGRAVEDLVNANPVITSAVLKDAQGRVCFTCLPTEGNASGVTVTFDLVNKVWTSELNNEGGAVSAAMVGGVYYRVSASGNVLKENAANWTDDNTWTTSTLETPNFHLAGLVGYQRCSQAILYAAQLTPCDLKIEIAYDNNAYDPLDVYNFSAAEIAVLDRPQLDLTLRRPLSQSVRVRVSDAAPTGGPVQGVGHGAIFIGLGLEVETLSGAVRRQQAAGKG